MNNYVAKVRKSLYTTKKTKNGVEEKKIPAVETNDLRPSTSELSNGVKKKNKSKKRKIRETLTKDLEEINNFSFNTLCDASDHSADFNITPPYLGVQYEFQRKPTKNVQITSCSVSNLLEKHDENSQKSQLGESNENKQKQIPNKNQINELVLAKEKYEKLIQIQNEKHEKSREVSPVESTRKHSKKQIQSQEEEELRSLNHSNKSKTQKQKEQGEILSQIETSIKQLQWRNKEERKGLSQLNEPQLETSKKQLQWRNKEERKELSQLNESQIETSKKQLQWRNKEERKELSQLSESQIETSKKQLQWRNKEERQGLSQLNESQIQTSKKQLQWRNKEESKGLSQLNESQIETSKKQLQWRNREERQGLSQLNENLQTLTSKRINKQYEDRRNEFREESPPILVPIRELTKSEQNTTFSSDSIGSAVINDRPTYESFDWENDQQLIILKDSESLTCHGFCAIKVLYGKLSVLGYVLHKQSKMTDIYSPRGSALLVIKNLTDDQDYCEDLDSLNKTEVLKNTTIYKTDVIFLCSRAQDSRFTFLEKYMPQQIFPKVGNSRSPQVIFNPKDKFNTTKISPQWDMIIELVDTSTKMVIVGGKGVGKSTFLRYAINSLLDKFQTVRVVDLDPGQSEFTTSGCISVVNISEPVFGPNYTHLKKVHSSYLTNINVSCEVNKYINRIRIIMESLDNTENIPTLINYMGFTRNIGLKIISSAITFIKPTHIVQIDSTDYKNNFSADLTHKTIREHCTMFERDRTTKLNFFLIKTTSMCDERKAVWSLEARQARELTVLSYFGQMLSEKVDHLLHHKIPRYKIQLSLVKLTNDRGENIAPAVVNGKFVALCSKMITDGCFEVLGHGVIQGICLRTNTLVLITPESEDILEKIVYLVYHSVSLPPSVYMTQNGVTGHTPFVMTGELDTLGQITRRSYLPANKS